LACLGVLLGYGPVPFIPFINSKKCTFKPTPIRQWRCGHPIFDKLKVITHLFWLVGRVDTRTELTCPNSSDHG